MNYEIAYPARDILGEGPLWSDEEQALYWVDIMKPCIRRWEPATGKHQMWKMPAFIGSFALCEDGKALLALHTGFWKFDFQTDQFSFIADPEDDLPLNRFNDGKTDPAGRFWAGTMSLRERDPLGSLYRLDPGKTVSFIRDKIIVSNGIGWSPDRKTMYYTDSGTQRIYAYDYDISTGKVENERILVQVEGFYPDGMTVDSEGFIWSANWDGWRVIRYASDGKVDRTIMLPVQRPTSCMFGGPDLKHMYITSARDRLSKEALLDQPHAGDVFVIETDIPGLPETRFKG